MSITICWRLVSDKGKSFKGGTSSSFKKLIDVFTDEICIQDIATLRAMAIASDDKFFNEVADKIEQVGSINIWAEY